MGRVHGEYGEGGQFKSEGRLAAAKSHVQLRNGAKLRQGQQDHRSRARVESDSYRTLGGQVQAGHHRQRGFQRRRKRICGREIDSNDECAESHCRQRAGGGLSPGTQIPGWIGGSRATIGRPARRSPGRPLEQILLHRLYAEGTARPVRRTRGFPPGEKRG